MGKEQFNNFKTRFDRFLYCGEQMNRWDSLEATYSAALEWLSRNLPEGALKIEEEEDGSRSWGITVQGSRVPLVSVYNEGKEDFYFIIG